LPHVAEQALALDSDWLRAHPLPQPEITTDKNGRGRVLALGGGRMVPGGILLTVEAALRAGAGKVQLATPASLALPLGIAMPEIAVVGMAEDDAGEISLGDGAILAPLIERCDCLVAGPAMAAASGFSELTRHLLDHVTVPLILDASLLLSLHDHAAAVRALPATAILTPHIGEMAALLQCPAETIESDRAAAAREASDRFAAICVLKGSTTLVAAPREPLYGYAGGGPGLATGGSGDVLAGIAAGLCARGADPLRSTLWAVWLQGEAGRRCAEQTGPVGFLARDLLPHLPNLLRGAGS
jgi:ADP-dependent NAD(P)H-hydrate dehydratase